MIDIVQKNLVVCGSFGYGNAGDEAIPESIQDMLNYLGYSYHLHRVARYDHVDDNNTLSLGDADYQKLDALKGSPVLMSGGGIFENRDNATVVRCRGLLSKSYTKYASLLAVSADAGVQYKWWFRQKLKFFLRSINCIYARDLLSEQVIKQILPNKKVQTVGDLVLWHQPAPSLAEIKLPPKYIAVCLAPRWAGQPTWMAWISAELHDLSLRLDMPIVFVSMTGKHDNDNEEHARIMAQIQKIVPDVEMLCMPDTLNAREVHHVFARASFVVSSRLHGCVMAYSSRVPFVGLAYHPKLIGFAQTVEWRNMMLPDQMPEQQQAGTYGYGFDLLGLRPGDLLRKAELALAQPNFDRLEPLKQASLATLKHFLDKANTP
jgi:polysaccharide pyruvyl transferase WcaK-like protein